MRNVISRLAIASTLMVVATWAVDTGTGAQEPLEPMSLADAGLSAAFAQLSVVDGGDAFQAASEPSVPDQGTPNPITRASVVTLNLGRAPVAADLVVNPELGIDVLNAGSAEFGVNQQTATVVMVETDRPPAEGGNAVDNLSLAYQYPGQEVLEQSPFANDPLIGFGTVLDRGSVQGEEFSSFQQIVNGEWKLFEDPIAGFGFRVENPVQGFAPGRSSTRYVRAMILFGPASKLAWISSHAGEAVAEALHFAIVELTPPTEFLRPNEVTTMEPLASSIVSEPVCQPDEELDNGICRPLCDDDSVFADGACVPITCGEGELVAGGVCVPITCGEGELVAGGVCEPITCGEGELVAGGVCEPITCGEGELVAGGVCVPIDEAFPSLGCDQLGGVLGAGGCGVTGLAEQSCAGGGGVPDGDVCRFADPPDETECEQLGSDYEWDGAECGLLVSGSDRPASNSGPAVGPQTADGEPADPEPVAEGSGFPADGDGGGSLLWLWLLLGGTAGGAILAWQLWKRAHGDDSLPAPAADRTPTVASERVMSGKQPDYPVSVVEGAVGGAGSASSPISVAIKHATGILVHDQQSRDQLISLATPSDLAKWARLSGTVLPMSGPLATAVFSNPSGGGIAATTVQPGDLNHGYYWTRLHDQFPILSVASMSDAGAARLDVAPRGSVEAALFFGYGAPTIPDASDGLFVNGPGTYTHGDPSSGATTPRVGLTIPNGWPDNIYVSYAEPSDFIQPSSDDAGSLSHHAAVMQRLMGTRVGTAAVDELPLLASSLLPSQVAIAELPIVPSSFMPSQVFVIAPNGGMPDAEELFGIAANLVFDDRLAATYGSLQFVTVAASAHPAAPGDDLAWGYRLLSRMKTDSTSGRVDLRPGDAFAGTAEGRDASAEHIRNAPELLGNFEYATDEPLRVDEIELLFAALQPIDTSFVSIDLKLTESWFAQGPGLFGGGVDQQADRDLVCLFAAYSF